MSAWRCLFWVQSLLGTGHLRRALTLAEAMAEGGIEVCLVNGGPSGAWPVPDGVTLVQLPPIVAADGDFRRLVAADARPAADALWSARAAILHERLEALRPQILLTEMFPFGRRPFRRELLPLVERARAMLPRPAVVASVRDVLVTKDADRSAWMAATARAAYDLVLVHGDARLLPFGASFPLAADIADVVRHTGYLSPSLARTQASAADVPAVLVSAGGGAVGARLLETALAARPLTRLADASWLLVGGANLPEARRQQLATALPPGCRLARHREDLPDLMARCDISVSQAGYNTVVEGLAGLARMVLVPYAGGGEDEQARRAARLAALDLATMVTEAELSPETLAAAIDRRSQRPRPQPDPGWFDSGARAVAALHEAVVRIVPDAARG